MARTERERAASSPRGATPQQLREAERGLRQVLAPTFSARWISQNLLDLLNEANAEYAEWLVEHRPASNPPGWLVQRARWRALDLVERENRRAGPPLDSVVHSAEDPEPTPDESVLERDRHRRIAEAMSHIAEKDRRLLALVYYEGHSIRAAGRLLGWGKSAADSHHAAAMGRLRALLGPREFLSPSLVGLVAQAIVLRDRRGLVGGIANRISAAIQDLADLVSRTVGSTARSAADTARRALPFSDAGTAAASGGAGRAIAQCGAIATAALCSAILLAPAEQGLDVLRPDHPASPPADQQSEPSVASPDEAGPPTPEASPRAKELSRSPGPSRSELRRRRRAARRHRAKIARARRVREERKARASRARQNEAIEAPEEVAPEVIEEASEVEALPETEAAPPPATGAQTRQEFGL